MTIQSAIQKAVEGGYDNDFGIGTPREHEYRHGEIKRAIHGYVLDPSFWQALGKSLGWTGQVRSSGPVGTTSWNVWKDKHWRTEWHHLIDHLAEGGSIESYFEKL